MVDLWGLGVPHQWHKRDESKKTVNCRGCGAMRQRTNVDKPCFGPSPIKLKVWVLPGRWVFTMCPRDRFPEHAAAERALLRAPWPSPSRGLPE